MLDFQKSLFVLAGLSILIGTASAQSPLTCSPHHAGQPNRRQEGTTEAVRDITIACAGLFNRHPSWKTNAFFNRSQHADYQPPAL
jgi:hypothetical protein